MDIAKLVLDYKKKHPKYEVGEDYKVAWESICREFNEKAAWLSRGYLRVEDGYLIENTNICGHIYIDNAGDCTFRDWNKGYLAENFDLFKDRSEVIAPLVFDSPEDYWAFVVKVKNKIYGIGE